MVLINAIEYVIILIESNLWKKNFPSIARWESSREQRPEENAEDNG
jgi:hypothetical protein